MDSIKNVILVLNFLAYPFFVFGVMWTSPTLILHNASNLTQFLSSILVPLLISWLRHGLKSLFNDISTLLIVWVPLLPFMYSTAIYPIIHAQHLPMFVPFEDSEYFTSMYWKNYFWCVAVWELAMLPLYLAYKYKQKQQKLTTQPEGEGYVQP